MLDHPVILGIGGFLGHDANAALMVGAQIVASSQEERYSRVKHDGSFPHAAISDCLAQAGLNESNVTDIVFAEKPLQSHLFSLSGKTGNRLTRKLGWLANHWPRYYTQPARQRFPEAKFHYAWHHLSHVAGAFHTSDFPQAAFLCVDGKGEDYSASAGEIDGRQIEIQWEQSYENGLGMLYTLVTEYLGFHSFGSEYKVMGLAPYGKPTFVAELEKLFTTDEQGGLQLRFPVRFTWESRLKARHHVAETTGIPVRNPDDKLEESHIDIAHSLQFIFEREILKMARFIRKQTDQENLILCGGCAQNCVAAGAIRASGIFKSVFNSPVGGDMGSGFGAALLLVRKLYPQTHLRPDTRGFYLGSHPGSIPAEAQAWRVYFEGELHDTIAAELATGKIVAWVRGGMELGARALGARSILADPRPPGTQSRLNLAVKFRESFRPFAPLILADHCGEWFDTKEPSNFMQYTANLREDRRAPMPESFSSLRERLDYPRCEVPSVIHVDYSARLQTVDQQIHPDLHRLLTAFYGQTGVPILINTSFNVSGQPIVRTAQEGWDCFVNTDIDLLVLNDQVFRNPHQKTREEKLAWLAQFSAHA